MTKVPTDVEEIVGRLLPNSIELSNNYPNPFNPSTTIEFAIPSRSFVSLAIYNVLGQKVKTLVDQNMPAGTFSTIWDSDNNSGRHVASGVYLYKLTVGENVLTKKMMLLKQVIIFNIKEYKPSRYLFGFFIRKVSFFIEIKLGCYLSS